MLAHFRATLWLLILTLGLCSVLYPLALWAVGQTLFPRQAQGSLLAGNAGQPVGSQLIAQPFGGDEYFQPRPSAAGYNAAASGASNWAGSNYLLRDRAARMLGLLVKYKNGPLQDKTVQQDIAEWFKEKPNLVGEWAEAHPGVAQAWVNADDKHKAAVAAWSKEHPQATAEWRRANPDAGEPKPADLAVPFFASNARAFHTAWPRLVEDPTWSLEAVFFDAWLQEHPNADLERVPADLVLASGSGLDPHITLKNAHYQSDRIAAARTAKYGLDGPSVRRVIDELLRQHAFQPLAGLAGGDALINVLEVNLALDERVSNLMKGK